MSHSETSGTDNPFVPLQQTAAGNTPSAKVEKNYAITLCGNWRGVTAAADDSLQT
jgi:hypothetical protein